MESQWNVYGYTMIVLFASIALIVAAFFAVDRLGLATRTLDASVVEMQHTPPGQTYTTAVIDGRSVVRAHETGDVYGVVLETSESRALALVSAEQYASLEIGEQVTASVRRTRITGRLQVVGISKK